MIRELSFDNRYWLGHYFKQGRKCFVYYPAHGGSPWVEPRRIKHKYYKLAFIIKPKRN